MLQTPVHCPVLFSTFLLDKTLTWTVPFFVPAKNPIHSSRPNSNAGIVAKLCLSSPGTVNHVLLHILLALYSWWYNSIYHILLCLVLYLPLSATQLWASWGGDNFMCSCRLLSTQHIAWPSTKWRWFSDMVKTLSLKPSISLSSGVTLGNLISPS